MDDDHPDHFFPVHSACEYIALDFFSFASNQQNLFGCCRADDSLVRSCADLYLAFETQYEIDVNRTRFPTEIQFRLQWKNKSRGAETFQHVVLSALPANTQTGGPEQPALFNKGWIRNPESKVTNSAFDPTVFSLLVAQLIPPSNIGCLLMLHTPRSSKRIPKK